MPRLRRFYELGLVVVKSTPILVLLWVVSAGTTSAGDAARLDAARQDEERLALWTTWLEEGRAGDVERALLALGERAEEDPRFCNLWGLSLASQGRRAEAIAKYERGIRLDPNAAELHLNLAVALAGQGARGRALAEFERAAELDPRSVDARVGWARLALDLRRPRWAREPAEQALALAPADGRVRWIWAELLETTATSAADTLASVAAWRAFEEVADSLASSSRPVVGGREEEVPSSAADAARRIGRLLETREPERAVEAYLRCAHRDPRAVDCAEAAAALYWRSAAAQEVVRLLRPAVADLSPAGYLLLLRALERRGAADDLEDVLRVRVPASGAGWGTVALVRRAAGDLSGALEACERGLEVADGSPDLYNLWGVLLAESGDDPAAIRAWERALDLDPTHAEALANLAARGVDRP